MRSGELLDFLKGRGSYTFTSRDAVRIMGKDEKYTSLFLNRLCKKGSIKKLEKGKYYISGANVYSIASNIVYPSYISLLSAFRFHDITTQIITKIDVISSKRHSNLRGIEEHDINFIRLDSSRIFGFYRNKETNAFVARIEKAIVDALYLQNPPYAYVEEAAELASEAGRLDAEQLLRFTSRMRSKATARRVNRLCRTLGIKGLHM